MLEDLSIEEYVEEVGVGGEVIVSPSGYYSKPTLVKIERLTKTLVILEGGSRFRRSGREVGNSGNWSWKTIIVPTLKLRMKIRHNELSDLISGINDKMIFEIQDIEYLKKLLSVLKERKLKKDWDSEN